MHACIEGVFPITNNVFDRRIGESCTQKARKEEERKELCFLSSTSAPTQKKLCHAPCQKKKGETGVCVQKMMNLDRQRRGRSHGQRAHDVTFSPHTHTRSVPTKKYPIRHFTREPKKTCRSLLDPLDRLMSHF